METCKAYILQDQAQKWLWLHTMGKYFGIAIPCSLDSTPVVTSLLQWLYSIVHQIHKVENDLCVILYCAAQKITGYFYKAMGLNFC